jgi:hypothetical protein
LHSYKSYKKLKNPPSISTYLITSPAEPFCLTYHQVTVKIKEEPRNIFESGTLTLVLYSADGRTTEEQKVDEKMIKFTSGHVLKFFIPHKDIGSELISAKLKFSQTLHIFRLQKSKIHIDSINLESLDYQTEMKICPKDGKALVSGNLVELNEIYCKI